MDKFIIQGPCKLGGTVRVSGAKNSALPIICATLLCQTEVRLTNIPKLQDIHTLLKLLEHLGSRYRFEGDELILSASENPSLEAPYDLVRKMRASFLVMGPLLARWGQAKVSLPGGCAIGVRPVDIHLKAFVGLGVEIHEEGGYVSGKCPYIQGNPIDLGFPSVGATENAMMAAVLGRGTTTLINAAREPEIEDLADFLNKCGGKITGAGSPVITIEGVKSLSGTTHRIIPDRIETGTLVIAGAMASENLEIKGTRVSHLKALFDSLFKIGVKLKIHHQDEPGESVQVGGYEKLKAVQIETRPHPGFPTDMQAQLMTLLCLAEGTSSFLETVFENRFMHVPELARMGAKIRLSHQTAYIDGPAKMVGAPVMVSDLRAGAALVLAGLVAQGTTEINRVYHIDRGYENLEKKLEQLGAQIERISS